jgi:hypothetical protein
VARWSAAVLGVPYERIMSGCRSTNSFANVFIRSTLPAPQRTTRARSGVIESGGLVTPSGDPV